MDQPKFKVGQSVKFKDDHNARTGVVLDISFHSLNASENTSGWKYTVSSKYFTGHEMAEGHITCREEELVDMTDYKGPTKPPEPTVTKEVVDTVSAEKPAQENGGTV